MNQSYPVPAATLERELEVKKSRFIARAAKVESREQAMAFLEALRADYPDARHHCWATWWVILHRLVRQLQAMTVSPPVQQVSPSSM